MNAYYLRRELRIRFLTEQQAQLAEDSKLADPEVAYLELLEELDADDDASWSPGEQAA